MTVVLGVGGDEVLDGVADEERDERASMDEAGEAVDEGARVGFLVGALHFCSSQYRFPMWGCWGGADGLTRSLISPFVTFVTSRTSRAPKGFRRGEERSVTLEPVATTESLTYELVRVSMRAGEGLR